MQAVTIAILGTGVNLALFSIVVSLRRLADAKDEQLKRDDVLRNPKFSVSDSSHDC
jgi:hypothetical protein